MDDFVLLVFRGDSVMFKKSEIINLIREEWFLANVLEMQFVDQKIPDKLEICEDKNTSMSLIETMRYNKLVVYTNVSLDYLLALADKWCVPEYVINMITDRIIHNVNVNRMESNKNRGAHLISRSNSTTKTTRHSLVTALSWLAKLIPCKGINSVLHTRLGTFSSQKSFFRHVSIFILCYEILN